MSGVSRYDLIVVGAGPGGYVAAIKAAQLGCRTALVERDAVGGTCLNRGCIPTKTLLHAAGILRELGEAERIGIRAGSPSVDVAALYARKDEVVTTLREGVEGLLVANGVETIRGGAFIPAAGRVEVGGTTYETRNILVAVGARPVCLSVPGVDLPGVCTSDDLLAGAAALPPRLLIVGGGVIGVEFATAYSAFGCAVTVIEAMDRLLPTLDREISQNLQMIAKRRGMTIHTAATLQTIERDGGALTARFAVKGEECVCTADAVLLSVGRRANTDGLFAEGLDLGLDRGAIPVDAHYRTRIDGIYAIGDVVAGNVQLAHVASAQGADVARIVCGKSPTFDFSAVPSCVYTTPEIASVGMTADEAKRLDIPVATGKFVMSANGKSVIERADRGFVKLVFHRESGKLLGAQLMCSRATDLIGELSTAMACGLTAASLERVVRAHPTFGEAIGEAVEDAFGQALYIRPQRR